MTVPLYAVLIVAVWAWALVAVRRDYREGGFASGLGAIVACLLAVIATLGILLAHSLWGVP